jgi:hypothetical protein
MCFWKWLYVINLAFEEEKIEVINGRNILVSNIARSL